MANKQVGIFIGSLRKESYNRKIANYLMSITPDNYNFSVIEIGDLPLYNEDYDQGNPPSSYTKIREEVGEVDAVLFITPEYNRSVPAVLKNAIDVVSRPYGENYWNGKPGGIISSSIGAISGFGANHHLRQSLVFVNVPAMPQIEAYLGNVASKFNDQGELTDKDTQQFLKEYLKAYIEWIERFI